MSKQSSSTLGTLAAMQPLTVAAAQAALPEAQAVALAAQAAARSELQRPLSLRVQTLQVAGAWGFVIAELRSPDDHPFDFTGTPLEESAREG